jgi:hypothetical protein
VLKARDEIPQEASSLSHALKNLGLDPSITIVFTSLFYIETWKTSKLMINELGMEPFHISTFSPKPAMLVHFGNSH